MIKIFKWLIIESSARWLFYILGAEYVIATNLSLTILTDYPILNNLVEGMAFIPAVHNFDKIATHPEAVRFYIALTILLVIPKSFAVYDWLKKNPNMWMKQLIITPLTTTKPTSAQLATRLSKTEEKIAQMPTEPRSRASAIFWSLMILGFGFIVPTTMIIHNGFSTTSEYVAGRQHFVALGGLLMWFQISLKQMTLTALMYSICAVIIRDYIIFFKSLFSR